MQVQNNYIQSFQFTIVDLIQKITVVQHSQQELQVRIKYMKQLSSDINSRSR
jgi:hypothetical protein